MAASGQLRLFCALRLPDDALDGLAAWQSVQLGAVRRVVRDNLHVTLAFLGARPAGELPAIAAELGEAARAAGAITFAPVGYRETRSVGMVLLSDDGGAASALAGDVAARLERIGAYRSEQRPWLPHVTVARFRERPGLDPPLPELGPFSPSDAAVYSSVLRREGAQYEALETVALGGR